MIDDEGIFIVFIVALFLVAVCLIWDIRFHRFVKCGEAVCLEFNYPTFMERTLNGN